MTFDEVLIQTSIGYDADVCLYVASDCARVHARCFGGTGAGRDEALKRGED